MKHFRVWFTTGTYRNVYADKIDIKDQVFFLYEGNQILYMFPIINVKEIEVI